MRGDTSSADFVIKCGNEEYQAHRFILKCHSKYFAKMFTSSFEVYSLYIHALIQANSL